MLMDKFFDAFNTHNMTEGKRKRKTMQDPYRTKDDWRFSVIILVHTNSLGILSRLNPFLQWLKDEFLKYLQDWEDEVNQKTGYTAGQKAKMLLSVQSLKGLRMTGMTIILYRVKMTSAYNYYNLYSVVTSFLELGPILLSDEKLQFLLTERFCQDPLSIRVLLR